MHKCGFTPQHAGLPELYETYRGRGLQILGTPMSDKIRAAIEQAL